MKDEDKTKIELIKELKFLREEWEKGVFKDISKLKKVEQSIQESESRFRELFKNISSGVAIYEARNNGRDFVIKDFNQAAEKIEKVKKEDIIGKSVLKVFPGVKDFGLFKVFQKVYKTGKPQHHPISLYQDQRITGWRENYIYKLPPGEIVAVYDDITERKKAEESLKKSEAKYRAVLEQSADNIFLVDLETKKILESNVNLRNLLGYSADEIKKLTVYDFAALPKDEIEKKIEQLQKQGKKVIQEQKFIRKDGSLVDVEIIRNIITFGNKKILCVVSRDISERKKAEETLKQSEKNYRDLFNNATDAIYIQDRECRFLNVNQGAVEMYGYPKEFFIGKTPEFLSAPGKNDLKKITGFVEDAFNGKPRQYDFWGIRKNGEIFPKIVRSQKGIYMGKEVVVTFATDITERKQVEKQIRDSEEYLKILFDYAPDAYYISDIKGKFIDGNKAAEKLVGYRKEELIGKSFLKLKLLSLADIPRAAKLLVKNLRGQSTGSDEFVLNRKDNSKVTAEISTYPIKIKGKILALGIARDITERKQAEENLKNAKDELQMIMDSVPATIFYKDTESRIIRANKTMANLLKLSIEDIVGKASEELFSKEQAEKMRKDDQEIIISGKPKRDIIQPYTTPDGIRWAITDKIPYKDKKGKVTGIVGLANDITVQRKVEQKLKLTYQKLKKTMNATIETVSRMIEAKDLYTAGHQQRVSQLAVAIAKELNIPQDKIEGIRIASLIHDIGKIGIPTEILSKPTKLTDIEFSLIKEHSRIGYDILKSIDFSYPVARIVLQHHEKMNGSGYPGGLKGDEILLEAKIISVADVVEAMSSHRPYRPALGIDAALEEITQNRGILYDPKVVDACLRLFKEKEFKFK